MIKFAAVAGAFLLTQAGSDGVRLERDDGSCSVTFAETSQGSSLTIGVTTGRERQYILMLSNPSWTSLKARTVNLSVDYWIPPMPDGAGGVKRFDKPETDAVEGAVMHGAGKPTAIVVLVSRDVLAFLAESASENKLHFMVKYNDQGLTDWMIFKTYMLNHLDKCMDPFAGK